ncbi:hypothetical protein AB1Y20_019577 [Prymnesium parvum]|uniref:Uncharacterized protein n=1 Tax=Prymnesium parvum TaxID=97485 RepID=A0AB34JUI9_PRYPA
MSANATRSNTAVEAPDTNTGRIDHIHISHGGGEQAPATSAAVVGASPNVGKGQEPQETPQRAPQSKWLEGLVRSIQGLGAGKGQGGGPSGQPPPPPYPPSDEEGEEDTAVAAADAAAASLPQGSREAAGSHEGDEGPFATYEPFVEEPLGAEAEGILRVLEARLKPQHTLRLDVCFHGSTATYRNSYGARNCYLRVLSRKIAGYLVVWVEENEMRC